jgi:hypothetical protein
VRAVVTERRVLLTSELSTRPQVVGCRVKRDPSCAAGRPLHRIHGRVDREGMRH